MLELYGCKLLNIQSFMSFPNPPVTLAAAESLLACTGLMLEARFRIPSVLGRKNPTFAPR